MFQVWNTESMLEFVEWIRSYNVEHPDRMVEFIGYDMQDQKIPVDSILAFLERTEPSLHATADSLYRDYAQAPSTHMPQLPDSVRQRWRENAEAMWGILNGRQSEWLASAQTRRDTADVQWAVQNANVVRQAAINNHTLSVAERDSFMAANLDWQIDRRPPDTRTIVWAHDTHVSRGGDAKTSFYGGATLGAYLSRRHGDDLRVFGLETHRGTYTATATLTDRRIVTAEATRAPLGSVEDALLSVARRLDSPVIVTDLRSARTDPRGAWLMEPRPIRSIGYAAYDYGFEQKTIAPQEFDALIFIEVTSGSVLLR
jgi:erythromycin esterase